MIVSERNNPEAQRFNAVWDWARTKAYPHAFGLVTMTEGARRFFPLYMRKRSWVIPNPVRLPGEWSPQRGNNNLIAVGRLVDQKGFDLLLEAFSKVARSFPDWTLTIWGEGPLRSELEARRDELGLGERVRMPGVTERPTIWIETADIFVLSSRYEGWGIVLLEAMAAGLPVVSFNCEWGPSDMVTDGVDGLLVPPLDVDALADALAKLMGDKTLRVRLAQSAARSAAKFAPDRINELWREAVQTAIDGN
ncbi:glycosyltransferase [Stappia sp. GBMRC 2046]|uniref:Glycosyltransferase n=1 Tax=Stappia sediminis TaxID=2692190 RepID=A0A7X3S9Y7_9HYPH|nr:glycosyltransferase [Stappia sediminis]